MEIKQAAKELIDINNMIFELIEQLSIISEFSELKHILEQLVKINAERKRIISEVSK